MKKLLIAFMVAYSGFVLADVESIVNKAVKVREITQQDARDIYLSRERVSSTGDRLTLFRFPVGTRTHTEFVRYVLGLEESAFESAWKKNVNAGLEGKYQTAKTQGEMMDRVSLTAFGVGYIDKDYLAISVGNAGAVIVRIKP